MNYSIGLTELDAWVKNTAKPGDIAYHVGELSNSWYLYIYKGFEATPAWKRFLTTEEAQKYLDENKEPEMKKRCENCKYWARVAGMHSYCSHDKHMGMYVPSFTACPEHEEKEKHTGPFDNLKFFIKDQNTGELELKYICEDCGKIMDGPFHWQFRVPLNDKPNKRLGYHYWCEECWEKEKK